MSSMASATAVPSLGRRVTDSVRALFLDSGNGSGGSNSPITSPRKGSAPPVVTTGNPSLIISAPYNLKKLEVDNLSPRQNGTPPAPPSGKSNNNDDQDLVTVHELLRDGTVVLRESGSSILIKQQATLIYGSPISDRVDKDDLDKLLLQTDSLMPFEESPFLMMDASTSSMSPSKRVELLRKQCEQRDAQAKAEHEAALVSSKSKKNLMMTTTTPRPVTVEDQVVREAFRVQTMPPQPEPVFDLDNNNNTDDARMSRSVLQYQQVAHSPRPNSSQQQQQPLTVEQMMNVPIVLSGSTIIDKKAAEDWLVKEYEKNLSKQGSSSSNSGSAIGKEKSSSSSSSGSSSTGSAPSSVESSPSTSVVYARPSYTQLTSTLEEFKLPEYTKIITSLLKITRGAVCCFGWKCWRTNPCANGPAQEKDNRGDYEHAYPVDPQNPEDVFQYQACLAFLRRCVPNKKFKTSSEVFLPMVREYIQYDLRKHPLKCARALSDDAMDGWLREQVSNNKQLKSIRPIKKGIFMLAAIYLDFVDLDAALDHNCAGPVLQLHLTAAK